MNWHWCSYLPVKTVCWYNYFPVLHDKILQTEIVYSFLQANSEVMSEVRDRIIEKAAIMFRTYGIRAVTMDMLSSELGISKRTIYEIFKDKKELLLSVLRWMDDRRRFVIERALDESPDALEAIFMLLRLSGDHMRDMNPVLISDLRKYCSSAEGSGLCDISNFAGSVKILEKGIAEGLFRSDINTEVVNRGIYGIFRFAMDNELFPSAEYRRQDIIRHIYLNLLRGICTEKGLILLNRHINDAGPAIL